MAAPKSFASAMAAASPSPRSSGWAAVDALESVARDADPKVLSPIARAVINATELDERTWQTWVVVTSNETAQQRSMLVR